MTSERFSLERMMIAVMQRCKGQYQQVERMQLAVALFFVSEHHHLPVPKREVIFSFPFQGCPFNNVRHDYAAAFPNREFTHP